MSKVEGDPIDSPPPSLRVTIFFFEASRVKMKTVAKNSRCWNADVFLHRDQIL